MASRRGEQSPQSVVFAVLTNLFYSRYQFEAQFRDWRIRKNTTRKEWEMHFEESDITDPATGPQSVRMTPAGCNKSLASFKRARRYVKKRPVPEQSILVQQEQIQATPQSQDIIDDYFNKISAPPAFGSPFELENALESLGTMPASHGGGKLNSQVATGSLSTLDPYDYTTFGDSIPELDLGQMFNRDFNAQLSVAGPLTIPLDHISPNTAFLEHQSPLEVAPLGLWSNPPVLESSVFSNILCSSRFADFEEYLRSKGFPFARRNTTELTRLGSSPSVGFGLGFFADVVLSKQQSITRETFDLESALRRLSNFVPGERTTVITQDQAFETKFSRILLFSLLNGFAGLNHAPIENILKSLGRLQIVSRSLLMILKDGPAHTSRTLADNIFRAAIEARDERILKQLLEHQLVNVSDTICFFNKKRYTPVERAASLEAYNVMRILVGYGADVNKSYTENWIENGGALTRLILAVSSLNRHDGRIFSAVTATPEITETVDMLISAGAIVTGQDLYRAGRAFTSYNIACRLSFCILPSDHSRFFPYGSILHEVADYTNEDDALQIIYNMIKLCERDACGKCLKAESVEWAAVQAAKRGYLRLVHLLINYVPSSTRIFTAAIRSKRRRLIDYVLTRSPELDPKAQKVGSLAEKDRTTPLSEAVSAGNEDLVNYFHAAGALNRLNEGDRFRPLVIAAACRGNMSYMQMLLSRANSSFHPCRPTGLAIYEALRNGHEDVALLLLANGAEVRPIRHRAFLSSPLAAALQRKNASLVCAILSSDIKEVESEELATAAELEDASTISILTLADPIISTSSETLRTLCMHCMKMDNVKFFRDLIDSIPPIENLADCLREAFKMGHSEMVRYLLDIGANPFEDGALESAFPDHPDMLQVVFSRVREGRTVPKRIGARIMKSIVFESLGGLRALDALLETQAVNFIIPESIADEDSDDDFWTPLGLALDGLSRHRDSNPWIVERLLRAGSDPNKIARVKRSDATESHTGLMLAIETAIQNVVQLLIDYGADVNNKPCFTVKRTPLQYAAELGDLDIVRMLLNLGADVNEEPALRSGGTALQFAAVSGNCNIAAELLNRGALLGALPSKVNGRWPLEAAAEHGRLDMIQFLWKTRVSLLGKVAGFERRQCLRAMNFARENGHIGCRDLISELSGIPVHRLDVENYGAPWLAYDGPDVLLAKLFSQVGTEPVPSLALEDGMVQQEIPYCIPGSLGPLE